MRKDVLFFAVIVLCLWAIYHLTMLSGNMSVGETLGTRSHQIEKLLEEATSAISRLSHPNVSDTASTELTALREERVKLRLEISKLESMKRSMGNQFAETKTTVDSSSPVVHQYPSTHTDKWLSIGLYAAIHSEACRDLIY
jgi:hypothetical protein